MGEIGEKGAFMEAVSWEEHFQAIRAAVAGAFKGTHGHPVAVHLLGMVRELVALFPILMEDEDHLSFYLRQIGTPWLITRRPCPWDWETMRPRLLVTVPRPEPLKGEEIEVVDGWGRRPTNLAETASFLALSKGLAWIVDRDGEKRPALLRGLDGLAPFPDDPRDIPKLGEDGKGGIPFSMAELALADDLAKGLRPEFPSVFNRQAAGEEGGPLLGLLEETPRFWMALPRAVVVGGDVPTFTPLPGALFEGELAQLLGVGLGSWTDLHLKGETRGTAWELSFSAICRGLEVDPEEKEAQWVFDVTPLWAGGNDTKRMAAEWTATEWEAWRESVVGAVDRAQERLRGAHLRARVGASATATADLSTGPEVRRTIPMRLASYLPGEGFGSVMGGQQIKFLNKPAPDPAKVVSLEGRLEARLKEGLAILEATGTAPPWMEENNRRNPAAAWKLREAERTRIREELGRSRHGVAEVAPNATMRWVRIGEDPHGRRWEFHLGGQWRFLDEKGLAKHKKQVEEDDKLHASMEKKIRDKWEGALLPPQEDMEDLEVLGKRRELNQARREALSSWTRAIRLLARLRAEQSSQRQETIEVDAETFKLWIWGSGDAPDNWLATVRETLGMLVDISATIVGITQGAGASLIRYEYRTKDAPSKGQEGAAGAKGSNLVFLVTLNRALLGGIGFLAAGTRDLPSGVKTLTFDTSKKNRDAMRKEIEGSGDRLEYSPEVHLDHFLDALGESHEVQLIGKTLSDHITPAGAAVAGGWTKKLKGKADPRQYTAAFCPLIPEDTFLNGALGSFGQTPEHGWKMGGRHNEARRTNYSLLEFMGIDLPTGNTEDRRREVYLQGLQVLRRVVVELGGGLLVGKLAGKWFNLAELQEEARLLHLLKNGRIFPFFAPGWIDRIRAAYETKVGRKLPKDRDEAQAARWKKPVEEEGFPLMVELKAAMERRGLTQAQAAEALGVSRMTISKWLKEKPLSPENEAKVRGWIKEEV